MYLTLENLRKQARMLQMYGWERSRKAQMDASLRSPLDATEQTLSYEVDASPSLSSPVIGAFDDQAINVMKPPPLA